MEYKLNYCQACLSIERKLYPLRILQSLHDISVWEITAVEGGVCWECRSLMTRFIQFKAQIHKAQQLLAYCTTLQDLTCLSKLSSESNHQFFWVYDSLSKPETAEDEFEIQQKLDRERVSSEERNISTRKLNISDRKINSENKCEREFDNYISEVENYEKEDDKYDSEDEKCLKAINQQLSEPKVEVMPSTIDANDIYVEILNANIKYEEEEQRKLVKVSKRHKKSLRTKIAVSDTEEEDEVNQKFATVMFTEQELIRIREEKRNQPNFKKIPYKCDSCVLGFTRKDTYDLHMEKKHDEKIGDFICTVCQIRFTNEKLVKRHVKKHYVCYRCRLCKYETLELWSALSHCRMKHDGDTFERIHCTYCDAVAKSADELSQHMGAEHTLRCDQCGDQFKGPSTLRAHKRRIHGVKREFICDICKKTFKAKSRLETHMASHNSALAQKLAYCALCKFQYKNIYVYRNHLKTNANHAQQTYQCRECNKRFASKVYWKQHYNFYHLRKTQYTCELCNKPFISDWRLKCHRQTQHGDQRSRDHHCSVCGKQFFALPTLKAHQLTHSEHRSFMCEVCGDTFKQRPALYNHYKLVHKGLKRRKLT